MNEANINYSHTYPINEEPNWVDEDLAVDESVLSESEFDLPEPEVEVVEEPVVEVRTQPVQQPVEPVVQREPNCPNPFGGRAWRP